MPPHRTALRSGRVDRDHCAGDSLARRPVAAGGESARECDHSRRGRPARLRESVLQGTPPTRRMTDKLGTVNARDGFRSAIEVMQQSARMAAFMPGSSLFGDWKE